MSPRWCTTLIAANASVAGMISLNAMSMMQDSSPPQSIPGKMPAELPPPAAPSTLPMLVGPVQPDGPSMQPVSGKAQLVSHPEPGTFEIIKDDFRRVHQTQAQALTREQIAQRIADGKGDSIRGDHLELDTFTDYLPANWMTGLENVEPGARVDSFGRPIVNDAFGLPGWAQQDVEDLRQEIADWLLHLDNLDLAIAGRTDEIAQIPPRAVPESYQWAEEELRAQRAETEMIVGNYFGQSVVRGIDVSAILPLNDARLSGGVVDSLATYLHSYEGLKTSQARRSQTTPPEARYAAPIVALLERYGHSMKDVLTSEAPEDGGIAGSASCYYVDPDSLAWSATVNGIGIWHGATPVDDAQADIPIGFYAYFDPCNDGSLNTLVRVSSNGYLSFYQQGWGAGLGTEYNNAAIPNAIDPDGFAAPWWDDLQVINQGVVDEVVYKIEGEVGLRVLTVEYWSVSRLGGSSTDNHYFQVKLYEQDSAITFHYGSASLDLGNENATIGVENFPGNQGDCGPNCGNLNSAWPIIDDYVFYSISMPNDTSSSATCVDDGSVIPGHTFGASGLGTACIIGNDIADVWFRYQAPTSGTLTVDTCTNVGFDTVLSVHTSPSNEPIACNDDACPNNASSLAVAVTGGTRYWIRVAGYNGQRGLFTLTVDSTAGIPPGDTCDDPLPISIPGTGTSHTLANNTGCEISCSGALDEWLLWTAPASGVMRATTCIGTTGNMDTTLQVYSGPCNSLSQIACNDDIGDAGGCAAPLASRVMWVADAGVTYRLRVGSFFGAYWGPYDLSLNYSTCPADIAPNPVGNGVIDVNDLLAVINGWGPCQNCRADFVPAGGDNSVNVLDLLAVLNAWGGCP